MEKKNNKIPNIPEEDLEGLNAYLELAGAHMEIDHENEAIELVFPDGNRFCFKGEWDDKYYELLVEVIIRHGEKAIN